MDKKESFKSFVANKPYLASYVESGKMSWQNFYELYDLYGESSSVWDSYNRKENNASAKNTLNDLFKSVDINSIKEHINTAQKALDFVQELTGKSVSNSSSSVVSPRPLNKFFED
ncbi:MAG: hypothetical protein E7164_02025 [Firmicutes bacterium]|nr:hypothetical protein [Bacillota bacterium]